MRTVRNKPLSCSETAEVLKVPEEGGGEEKRWEQNFTGVDDLEGVWHLCSTLELISK
jgi:hypothetical protein